MFRADEATGLRGIGMLGDRLDLVLIFGFVSVNVHRKMGKQRQRESGVTQPDHE